MTFKGQKRHKKLKVLIAEMPELPEQKIKINRRRWMDRVHQLAIDLRKSSVFINVGLRLLWNVEY